MQKRYRKAVFIVTYAQTTAGPRYLLAHRILHWNGWEFPKGGIEPGESKKEAAKRELKEETHLRLLLFKSYPVNGKYPYDAKTRKKRGFFGQTYTLFSAQVQEGKARLDPLEHDSYRWQNYQQALKLLTWGSQRKCLRRVHRSITG